MINPVVEAIELIEIEKQRSSTMSKSSVPSYRQIPIIQNKKQEAKSCEEKQEAETPTKKKLESKPSVDINESAEAFIRKFREQLMIQRLNSIENYEKMLSNGI